MEQYGLRGLIPLIKPSPNDNQVTLGTDLNNLGLDMSSEELLSLTFPSPWNETSRSAVEPVFHLPESFKVPDTDAAPNKLSLLSEDALFYIFYARTQDQLQELASRELFKRNWRYHKELQVWLTKDLGSEPQPQGPGSERGVYIFFDPHSWCKVKKDFTLQYAAIMTV